MYAEQAMKLEAKAAAMCPESAAAEPTRSILFRSAATLALQAEKLPKAIELAEAGLTGNPPDEIASELRQVILQASIGHE